jgi:hypothetical protein
MGQEKPGRLQKSWQRFEKRTLSLSDSRKNGGARQGARDAVADHLWRKREMEQKQQSQEKIVVEIAKSEKTEERPVTRRLRIEALEERTAPSAVWTD